MALKRQGAPAAETQEALPPTTQPEPEESASPPFEANAEQLAADEAEAAAKAALAGPDAAASTSTALTSGETSTAVIAASPPASKALAELAAEGFADLEEGFGSYPIIKLENEGIFADTEGNELGDKFECVIISTRAKHVVKNTKCDKKEEEVVYSYDREHDTEGNPLQPIIDDWKGRGWGCGTKKYLECAAQVVETGDMVLLSIPPASTRRITGHIRQNQMKHQLNPNQYVTLCKCGKKVTNTAHDFYPWDFEFVAQLAAD